MTEETPTWGQRGEKARAGLPGPVCPHCPALGCAEESDDIPSCSGDPDEVSETVSNLSEDLDFPDYERSESSIPSDSRTLYALCVGNASRELRDRLVCGVSEQEVKELDSNGRNGLMISCYEGFVDIVNTLDKCPGIDINHQDHDGNTALMIAAQAGHATIVSHLLNYYSGAELEMRDGRGFTALMKAAIQGRAECVAALIMAGADVEAVDVYRGKTAREWALLTGRYETSLRIKRLLQRPCPDQLMDTYVPEWPELKEMVAIRSRREKILQRLCSFFTLKFPCGPEDNGAMDQLVRMTTSLASPFLTTGCCTVSPGTPPQVGKRCQAVPDILLNTSSLHTAKDGKVEWEEKEPLNGGISHCESEKIIGTETGAGERRASAWSAQPRGVTSFPSSRTKQRNSIVPTDCVPQIFLVKASPPTCRREKEKRQRKTKNRQLLQLPKWKYKELKEEKKKAEALRKK
ncbi:photoreceptor ankyrin repeat protein [Callorhinchus milii]|uniref:photoreceptor ankyrin repeat protein n=1 Tax=Callorhinchus milii TaxID=7868 RepID=UPI001C3F8898|nr:photoreceptor ankyrin repeat protein [Callorhinchus milii]